MHENYDADPYSNPQVITQSEKKLSAWRRWKWCKRSNLSNTLPADVKELWSVQGGLKR